MKNLKDLKRNPKTNQIVNRFAIVLDSSGSMQGIARPTVDAFNANVEAIRDASRLELQKSTVTYLTFSERDSDVNVKFTDEDVNRLSSLAYNDYYPRGGGTALWDAVAGAIQSLKDLPFSDSKDVANILLIVTDGGENASRKTSLSELKRLIRDVEQTDHWTLAFLVPNGTKAGFCRDTGISEGNVREWEQTTRGVIDAQRAFNAGMRNFLSLRSQGKTSTKGFFVTDMSKVSAATVKKSLNDVSGSVRVLSVDAETMIQPFVERKTGSAYVKGNGFYQLTKDETVQPYKQIMLMEKGKSAIYTGDAARQLLGLPDSSDVKVRPGNHANYDIFVQSTSVNRKLVRGTKLLYVR